MRQRERRTKVALKGRMRLGVRWCDVSIRNISSRGLLVQAEAAPERGTFVEIRRGPHVIVARVAWSQGPRFGVQTQERLDVASIIAEPDLSKVDYKAALAANPAYERRSASRPPDMGQAAERSRLRARALEWVSICIAGAIAAGFALDAVSAALAPPLAAVRAELGAP